MRPLKIVLAALVGGVDAVDHLLDLLAHAARRDAARRVVLELLGTATLGLEFDPDKSWDEKKEVYRLSNEIVRTQNVTQSAIGDKKGLWTTVVAAAVLVG